MLDDIKHKKQKTQSSLADVLPLIVLSCMIVCKPGYEIVSIV